MSAGGLPENVITRSRIDDIAERRAPAYGNDYGDDCPSLRKLARKLEDHMPVARTAQRSLPVLPDAYRLFKAGSELREVAGGSWKYEVDRLTSESSRSHPLAVMKDCRR